MSLETSEILFQIRHPSVESGQLVSHMARCPARRPSEASGGFVPVGTAGDRDTELRFPLASLRHDVDTWDGFLTSARDRSGQHALWDTSHSHSLTTGSLRWCSEALLSTPRAAGDASMASPRIDSMQRVVSDSGASSTVADTVPVAGLPLLLPE